MNEKQKKVFTTTQTYIGTLLIFACFITWGFLSIEYLLIDKVTSGTMSLEKAANLSAFVVALPIIISILTLIVFCTKSKKEYFVRTGNKVLFYSSLCILTVAMIFSGNKYLDIKTEQKFLDFETNIIMSNPDWNNSSNQKVRDFLTYKKDSNNFKECINKCDKYLIDIYKNKELYKI